MSLKTKLTKWSNVFDNLYIFVRSKNFSDTELLDNLIAIEKQLSQVLLGTDELEFEGIQANGYWTIVKLCTRFCHLVENKLNDGQNMYQKLVIASGYLAKMTRCLTEMQQKVGSGQKNIPIETDLPFCYDLEMSLFPLKHKDELALITEAFGGFWFQPPLYDRYKLVISGLALGSMTIQNFIRLPWKKNPFGHLAITTVLNMSLERASQWNLFLTKTAFPLLRFISKNEHVNCSDVYVHFKCPYVLIEKLGVSEDHNRKPSMPVRCRLIENRNTNNNNRTLVLHCHGGGFAIGSPDSDEIGFLREWCEKLPDITFLSVDNRLHTHYYEPLQQILDVYFWLKQEQAVSQLGFCPENIVLFGESSGATYMMQLILVLTDIQHKIAQVPSTMPSGIVAINGAFCPVPLFSPSRVLTMVDIILSSSTLLAFGTAYTGVTGKALSKGEMPSTPVEILKLTTSLLSSEFKRCFSSSGPWFLSTSKFAELEREVMDKAFWPYGVPLAYENFERINIPIFLIASEFCPLLDDTILLAKRWKGQTELDVVKELPHGFLQLSASIPHVKDAQTLCMKKLEDACRRPPKTGLETEVVLLQRRSVGFNLGTIRSLFSHM